MLLISEQSEVNLVGEELKWVVDSGASFHLTPNRVCFSSYKVCDYRYMKMGNDDACKIVEIGEVHLLTSTCCIMVLKDVRHVQDIRLNLISARQFDDEVYSGTF